jgi:2-amino-4-hydroxy-6-hydroxymethyldihydropteridine diphosphokinase
MNHTYFLHLGSNQGERKENLEKAIEQIKLTIGKVIKQSLIYETEPWGLKDQPNFLNMAIECYSGLKPHDLIVQAKAIEESIGTKKDTKWGPRLIDIDILYCEDLVLEGELTIPHPQIANRNFVLIPLMEIAGDFIDPNSKLTIEELYDVCEDIGEVMIYEE